MFSIDFKGHTNLIAQEIVSAVGMRGFYIVGLGEFDFWKSTVEAMIACGDIRPVSMVHDGGRTRAEA